MILRVGGFFAFSGTVYIATLTKWLNLYHTEVGSNLYHICEFAERMQKNGATYEPKPAEQTSQKTPKHKDLER